MKNGFFVIGDIDKTTCSTKNTSLPDSGTSETNASEFLKNIQEMFLFEKRFINIYYYY